MGYISKRQISEVEVLKELRSKFKRNRREFMGKVNPKTKAIAEKYDDYIASIDTALFCISRFPFIDFWEVEKRYQQVTKATKKSPKRKK
jgi:hypothetical protein